MRAALRGARGLLRAVLVAQSRYKSGSSEFPCFVRHRLECWKSEVHSGLGRVENIGGGDVHAAVDIGDGDCVEVTLPGDSATTKDLASAVDLKFPLACSRDPIVGFRTRHSTTVWDLHSSLRELDDYGELAAVRLSDGLAKPVLWHSTAHLLGCALELFYFRKYGRLVELDDGPALDMSSGPSGGGGFFYDYTLQPPGYGVFYLSI